MNQAQPKLTLTGDVTGIREMVRVYRDKVHYGVVVTRIRDHPPIVRIPKGHVPMSARKLMGHRIVEHTFVRDHESKGALPRVERLDVDPCGIFSRNRQDGQRY